MKAAIFIVSVAALVAIALADDPPIDWYKCTGEENGNYPHPVDCTRFVTCSNELAYERDCAVCEYHPYRCPEGRLIFDQVTNMCLFANEATCSSLCADRGVKGRKSSLVRGARHF